MIDVRMGDVLTGYISVELVTAFLVYCRNAHIRSIYQDVYITGWILFVLGEDFAHHSQWHILPVASWNWVGIYLIGK